MGKAGSGRVACPAVPAVLAIALGITDEPAAAITIEHHHFGLFRLRQLDAGAAQGVFDIHVVSLNKAP